MDRIIIEYDVEPSAYEKQNKLRVLKLARYEKHMYDTVDIPFSHIMEFTNDMLEDMSASSFLIYLIGVVDTDREL